MRKTWSSFLDSSDFNTAQAVKGCFGGGTDEGVTMALKNLLAWGIREPSRRICRNVRWPFGTLWDNGSHQRKNFTTVQKENPKRFLDIPLHERYNHDKNGGGQKRGILLAKWKKSITGWVIGTLISEKEKSIPAVSITEQRNRRPPKPMGRGRFLGKSTAGH